MFLHLSNCGLRERCTCYDAVVSLKGGGAGSLSGRRTVGFGLTTQILHLWQRVSGPMLTARLLSPRVSVVCALWHMKMISRGRIGWRALVDDCFMRTADDCVVDSEGNERLCLIYLNFLCHSFFIMLSLGSIQQNIGF